MTHELARDMLMSVVRKLLAIAGAWLVQRGIFAGSEWATWSPQLAEALTGAALVLGATGWSLLNKWWSRVTPE